MTTEPELIEKTTEDAEIQTASKQEGQQEHGDKGVCARVHVRANTSHLPLPVNQQYHHEYYYFTYKYLNGYHYFCILFLL